MANHHSIGNGAVGALIGKLVRIDLPRPYQIAPTSRKNPIPLMLAAATSHRSSPDEASISLVNKCIEPVTLSEL
jgi:hypothetical protein